jgi:hypothetical protein
LKKKLNRPALALSVQFHAAAGMAIKEDYAEGRSLVPEAGIPETFAPEPAFGQDRADQCAAV